MKSFIEKIIEDIPKQHLDNLRNCCYIFPTRRGKLMFQQLLSARFEEETFWSPYIMSIEDFMERMTYRKVTDDLTLLFELYDVYLQFDDIETTPFDSFDKFFPWGEILLKDFDEIDKYLVDASDIYQNIYDIKQLEAAIGVDEELTKAVEQFRSVVSVENKTVLLENFLRIWAIVGDVYTAFKAQLKKKKLAYEGMLYREILGKIKSPKHPMKGIQLIFCGFNALSNTEEEIFDYLLKREEAWVYWDADILYMENQWFEAGMFLRTYKEKWTMERSKWFIGDMMQTKKEIHIVSTVQHMAQVKIASKILKKTLDETDAPIEQTALVLANENLLMPMLYALPDNVMEANVTMGYPLQNTPLTHLVNSLFDLHSHQSGKNKIYFRTEDVSVFLNNAYVQSVLELKGASLSKWLHKYRKTYLFIEDIEEKLEGYPILLALFKVIHNSTQFIEMLIEFLKELFLHFTPEDYMQNIAEIDLDPDMVDADTPAVNLIVEATALEQDYIYLYIQHLNIFYDNVKVNIHRLNLALLKKMLQETLGTLKASFSGGTNKGLQVMGFLETRTLDFENLFILSANEGNLPMERKLNSYIPFSLRKAFKMPTFEEQDAIYAYHFYRLLQTTKKVVLIYDSELGGNNNERSRFIAQLLNAVKYSYNPNITITEKTYATAPPQVKQEQKAITVEKTASIMEHLRSRMYKKGNRPSTYKYFSPTALSTYIACPLQFYLKYVADLKETPDESTKIEANDFGNIVHKTLEHFYEPFKNEQLVKEKVAPLNKEETIVEHMNDALKEARLINETYTELQGKNVIAFTTIKQIINDVLNTDLESMPFKLHELETNSQMFDLNFDGEFYVGLNGTIDRVDEIEDLEGRTVRIVDYKTGEVKDKTLKMTEDVNEYIELLFTNTDYRYVFQAFYYSFLYWKANPSIPLKPGIYSLKETDKGVQMIPDTKASELFSTKELLEAFERRLKLLFQELMQADVAFKQTEDSANCRFCAYREICSL